MQKKQRKLLIFGMDFQFSENNGNFKCALNRDELRLMNTIKVLVWLGFYLFIYFFCVCVCLCVCVCV